MKLYNTRKKDGDQNYFYDYLDTYIAYEKTREITCQKYSRNEPNNWHIMQISN